MKWIKDLFDDNNTINEKSVVGFVAFILLCLVFIIDMITGYMGKELTINKMIFDGFMVLVLGTFGIASIDKWVNKKNPNNDNTEQ